MVNKIAKTVAIVGIECGRLEFDGFASGECKSIYVVYMGFFLLTKPGFYKGYLL